MFIPIIPTLPPGTYHGRQAKRAAFAARARKARRWRRKFRPAVQAGAVGSCESIRFVSSPVRKD